MTISQTHKAVCNAYDPPAKADCNYVFLTKNAVPPKDE